MTRYRIHGLLVESEIPLDAALADPSEAQEPDYRIARGEESAVPGEAPPGRLLAETIDPGPLHYDGWACEDPDEPARWVLRYSGACDVVLDRTKRLISVHEAASANREVVAMLLEGSVLAYALSAEGRFVMHATAVEVDGKALAVVGGSGAGKSTIAALMCAGGARLVSEDALRCDPVGERLICFQGGQSIRLREGVAHLAEEIPGATVRPTGDGRVAVRPMSTSRDPVELTAVVVPSFSREASRLEVEELAGLERAVEMLRYPRLTGWVSPTQIGRLFESATAAADLARVYTAGIPWGPPYPPSLPSELLTAVGIAPPEPVSQPATAPDGGVR